MLVVASTAWSQDALTDTVPRYASYLQPLERAWHAGVIVGYPDGSFRPNDILTRSELWEGFNRLLDVVRVTKGLTLEDDVDPTYARGVRDHWAFGSWERLLAVKLLEHRPVPPVRDMAAEVTRLEFAELAVATMRAYGAANPDMSPVQVAIGDTMVRQADGKVHFHSAMPRWEFAVAMARLLDTLGVPAG